VVVHTPELDVEGAGDGEEEVEVDRCAGDREEDLLHEVAGEDPRERGPGDDRREHEEHGERAEIRRQNAVQGNGDRVTRDDRERLDPVGRIAGPEDPDPGERRENGLQRLQNEPEHQIPDCDVRDRVPKVGDPAP
jgi:hypothetical protein